MFEEEDELPDDEEEIVVYVEFDGSVVSNTFGNEKLTLDMIGLDKEHPIMQVNGKYYEGTYQDVVGTYMFFEKDKNPPVDDPVFDATPTLKYRAKTRKLLKMQRIFVEPKTEMLGDSNDKNCIPNMETINAAGIPPRYQEAALKSWENMRDDRMAALNKYLEKQRIREEKRSQGIEPDSESDDDNPFAMYKPEAKHKRKKAPADDANTPSEECRARMDDRNSEDNERLTVIDPGPSTSKDSQPWSSPATRMPEKYESQSGSDDEAYRTNLPNVIGKHRATVKVMTKGKVRKYSRGTKKKCNKKAEKEIRGSDESEDNADDLSRENEDERVDDAPTDDVTEAATSENAEAAKRPEVDVSNAEEASESTNDKRKVEKQQKRDEKMRLLSERLKKAAAEVRLRTHRTDEASGTTETLRNSDEISENAESTVRMEVDVSNTEVES